MADRLCIPYVEARLLQTARLRLRRWTQDDWAPFARINSDPEAMRHLPGTLDEARSFAWARRIDAEFSERGHGLWAVELAKPAAFIGFAGVTAVPFEAAFTPAFEIGWWLAREHWHQGYATEAAAAVLDDAFSRIVFSEILAETSALNAPSLRVIRRLGMKPHPTPEFAHPWLAADHPLSRHLLYSLTPDQWEQRRRG